jgi:hypothetical protein
VTNTFIVISRVVLVIAIVFACVISAFSYLAGISAATAKCAELAWVEGYRNAVFELFLGLPFAAMWIVVLAGIVAIGRSERLRIFLNVYNLPVFEFLSIQVTLGESIIYRIFLMMLVMLGIVTGISITRYYAIFGYCMTVK